MFNYIYTEEVEYLVSMEIEDGRHIEGKFFKKKTYSDGYMMK